MGSVPAILIGNGLATALSLYLLCLSWGLATGAAVAGVTAAALGGGLGPSPNQGFDLAEVLRSGSLGAAMGIVVAIVPTVIGSVFVISLAWRPTDSWSPQTVRHDLNVVLAFVVTILDGCTLALMIFLDGPLLELLPLLLLGNGAALAVLWLARASIGRALSAAWRGWQ